MLSPAAVDAAVVGAVVAAVVGAVVGAMVGAMVGAAVAVDDEQPTTIAARAMTDGTSFNVFNTRLL